MLLIGRHGWIDRAFSKTSWVLSRYASRGSAASLANLAICRVWMRLLGVNWMENYSVWQLWRM